MKIKELIEELQKFDENANVSIYTEYYKEPFLIQDFNITSSKDGNAVSFDCGNQEAHYAAGHFLGSDDPLFTERIKGLAEDMKRIYCNTGGSTEHLMLYDYIDDKLNNIKTITGALQRIWNNNSNLQK